ncbi:MAG: DUF924 family protein, partial [Candidatus Competibacteraceae bacterium]|nr:DUF924 family protein [Candidatus Competibacteraceae bacterium]
MKISPSKVVSSSEITTFWFSEEVKPLWFDATPEFDDALRERFLATYQAAANGARVERH